MVHQTDICTPPDRIALYKTDEYKKELAAHVDLCRKRLDSGFGNCLLRQYHSKENDVHRSGSSRKDIVLIAGALLMREGAKICAKDLKHLRELPIQVSCSTGKRATIEDWDSCAPGKMQFLAALDNYKAGMPRGLQNPR